MPELGPQKCAGPRVPGEARAQGIATTRELLARHGFRTDKSLGQHFLVSAKTVQKIVSACGSVGSALEIGPGAGALTVALCEASWNVTAIEIDPRSIGILRETVPAAEVIEADALETDWLPVIAGLAEPRVLVSNMPYNITGPLLERACACAPLVDRAVLMMQREVAQKIMAKPGDAARGAVSVVIQATFGVSLVCHVPPGAFLPPPKVESTVLRLEPRAAGPSAPFVRAVRTGFRQPRKTLVNNLSEVWPKNHTSEVVAATGLVAGVRPHQLDEDAWLAVSAGLGEP